AIPPAGRSAGCWADGLPKVRLARAAIQSGLQWPCNAFTNASYSEQERVRVMRKLPKDTMTARERIQATLDGRLPDRVPIFHMIHNVPLIERITGEKATLANGLDLLCRAIGDCLDITRGISAPAEDKIIRQPDG